MRGRKLKAFRAIRKLISTAAMRQTAGTIEIL